MRLPGWVGPCWQRPWQAGRTGAAGSPSACPGARGPSQFQVGAVWSGHREWEVSRTLHPCPSEACVRGLAWFIRRGAAHLSHCHPKCLSRLSSSTPSLAPRCPLSHWQQHPSVHPSFTHLFTHSVGNDCELLSAKHCCGRRILQRTDMGISFRVEFAF